MDLYKEYKKQRQNEIKGNNRSKAYTIGKDGSITIKILNDSEQKNKTNKKINQSRLYYEY